MINEQTEAAVNEAAANAPAEVNPAELPEGTPAAIPSENTGERDDNEKQELLDKINGLEAELMKEQIKVKLLILGILPEKLEDGAAMAYGLYLAGKSSDEAAEEIITAYPHLKAVRRELPQISTESSGSGDGFSAIRRIFSAR